MSMALQLICNYSDSDDNDQGDDATEITTKQLNSKSIPMTEEGEILEKIKPVIELKSVEDIEKWKEERRKRFPKVPSSTDLDNKHITGNLNSAEDKKVKGRCIKKRGAKRKNDGHPWSSAMVSQRKLTLFEKVTGQNVTEEYIFSLIA